MALTITCDCGQVSVEVPGPPQRLTACPCRFCRRTGALWAYYHRGDVVLSGATETYRRGARRLDFHRCSTCGGLMSWRELAGTWTNAGVNMAQAAPETLRDIPVGPPQ